MLVPVEESFTGALQGARVRDFRGSGVLTDNAGLVLTLASGEKFQITIVKGHSTTENS